MHIKNQKSGLVVATLALALGACSAEEKSDATDTEEDPLATVVASTTTETPVSPLVGTWIRTNCADAAALQLADDGGEGDGGGDGGDGGEDGGEDKDYKREIFSFSKDGKSKITMQMYQDAECANQGIEMVIEGSYTVGAELSTAPSVRELDMSIDAGSLAIMSQDFLDMLNGASLADDGGDSGEGEGEEKSGKGFCTKTTPWVLGEAVALGDLDCDKDFPALGGTIYEIASIDGGVLQMSDEDLNGDNHGETAATRPTIIGTTAAQGYKKKVD